MIETSCDIHTGASGGMIIKASDASFVGLITQNTVQTDGVILSKLNGSLPYQFLFPFLHPFLKSGGKDKSIDRFFAANSPGSLRKLNEPNPERERIWGLEVIQKVLPPSPFNFHKSFQSKL